MKKKNSLSAKLVVTLASATLSSCIGAVDPAPTPSQSTSSGPPVGAVDPAPPPLECTAVEQGQFLAIGETKLDGLDISFTINNGSYSSSFETKPTITAGQGLTIVSAESTEYNGVNVKLRLDSSEITKGELTIEGNLLARYGEKTCPFKRTLQLSIEKTVKISQSIHDIPLDINNRVAIAIVNRNGLEVELSGNSTNTGKDYEWTVEEGSIAKKTDTSSVWTLPEKPGIYQVELVVNHEDDSFSYDTLFVDVT